ncbi:MAG: hypothetical protein NUV86_00185 [Candidatus Scalindua sp.]|nr:hypothetical protein [Candidatus Scalindua sp.]MCR4345118.1 hypothetical protein [Candidatus Scalindua sp.]
MRTQLRLSARLKIERKNQVYGDITQKLVGIFQEARKLRNVNFGIVDESTAKTINALLKELGILDEDKTNPYSVSDGVYTSKRIGAAQVSVQLVDKSIGGGMIQKKKLI